MSRGAWEVGYTQSAEQRGGRGRAGRGLLMLVAWLTSQWSEPLSVVLYVISYAVGGWVKAKEGVETLLKERDLDVNLLMIAAAMGAAAIGYWNEGAMLIFIFALSGALESYTMERSRKDISSLMELHRKRPFALRRRDGIGIHQQAGDRRSDSGKAGRAYSGRRQNLSRRPPSTRLRLPGNPYRSISP